MWSGCGDSIFMYWCHSQIIGEFSGFQPRVQRADWGVCRCLVQNIEMHFSCKLKKDYPSLAAKVIDILFLFASSYLCEIKLVIIEELWVAIASSPRFEKLCRETSSDITLMEVGVYFICMNFTRIILQEWCTVKAVFQFAGAGIRKGWKSLDLIDKSHSNMVFFWNYLYKEERWIEVLCHNDFIYVFFEPGNISKSIISIIYGMFFSGDHDKWLFFYWFLSGNTSY